MSIKIHNETDGRVKVKTESIGHHSHEARFALGDFHVSIVSDEDSLNITIEEVVERPDVGVDDSE